MRVPAWDVYRAFPELDGFDDERCREYVRLARRKRWPWMLATHIGQAMVVFFGLPFLGLAHAAIAHLGNQLVRVRHEEPAWLLALSMVLTVTIVIGPMLVIVLMMRDFTLRRAIRAQLAGVKCLRCSYSLLGLKVADGVVTCPECGYDLVLSKLGLTAADLLADGHET